MIVALFGIFAIATYSRITGNFERSAVQKAVADRLPDILPVAGQQLQKAATNALPVYKQLATERYEKVRGELAHKSLDRVYRIPEETGTQMSDQLHLSFEKALKKVEPDLKKAFPSLTNQQKQDILNVYFNDAIEARNKEIATHITNIYSAELVKVHNAFDSFDVPTNDNPWTTPTKLHRDFLHTLLVLADYAELHERRHSARRRCQLRHPRPRPQSRRPDHTAGVRLLIPVQRSPEETRSLYSDTT